jgi:integrase
MYKGMECRETLKLEHTKANIKFAERLRGEILNAIELGTFSYAKYFPESATLAKLGIQAPKHMVTVGDLLREQYEVYERTLAASTLQNYRRSYKALLKPQWENTLLRDLTPAAIRAWLSGLNLKAPSVRQLLIPFRSALDQAVNDDLLTSSPLDRVKLRKVLDRDAYASTPTADPFSAEEIGAILAVAEGQMRNVWQFAFSTGMRPSEYMALRWDSVDLIAGTIKVERARVVGITRDETKTRASKRVVDMRRGAFDALRAQEQYSRLANGPVFLDPATGKGWGTSDRLRKLWTPTLKRAGVRHRAQYQTRHTFASTLLSTGENMMYVAKQLGHTDTTMVTRTYGRWIEQEDGVLPEFFYRIVDGKKKMLR